MQKEVRQLARLHSCCVTLESLQAVDFECRLVLSSNNTVARVEKASPAVSKKHARWLLTLKTHIECRANSLETNFMST